VTVVVAFVGNDGAVMASDTERTESVHTRMDVEKIWTVGGLLCA
jgi:20S proteasome alpha/beta subunit